MPEVTHGELRRASGCVSVQQGLVFPCEVQEDLECAAHVSSSTTAVPHGPLPTARGVLHHRVAL